MYSTGIPALHVHLALEVVHAVLPLEFHREAVSAEGPLQLVPAGKTQIAFLMPGAGGALRFSSAKAQRTISLVTLGIYQAVTPR